MSVLSMRYVVTMNNGEKWSVPVSVIATHRATHYAKNFGGDVLKSLNEATVPLFTEDEYEIEDWAKNNMNWSDVVESATRMQKPGDEDLEDGWINGEAEIL